MSYDIYDSDDDFFDLFEDDSFDREELFDDSTGKITGVMGFADGKLVATFNFYTFEGWYDDDYIKLKKEV
jgi:hypothetical protein